MLTVKLPHSRVNLIWSTDWHFSATPPGRRGDNYLGAMLAKLDFIRDITEKLKGVGLCGGDVFHSKNPKSPSNSFLMLVSLIQALRRFPLGKVFGSVGNHDLSFDRMDTLPKQPLGLLIAAHVYHDLNQASVLFTNEEETVKVLVETFPYEHSGTMERIMNAPPRPEGVNYRVGVVHAYGEPGDGGTLYGEPKIGYNQVAGCDFDFLCWGHDHSRKETETVGNTTHVHLGSLARAALETDQVDRPVSCAILSFAEDGIRYKEKEIPVTPLAIAFQVADKPMDKVAKSEAVQEFFADMDEQVDGIESTDPREVLKQLCPQEEPQLLSLVQELCEL